MIISEKQIYELMAVARYIAYIGADDLDFKEQVASLLCDIENQQSEELREVK